MKLASNVASLKTMSRWDSPWWEFVECGPTGMWFLSTSYSLPTCQHYPAKAPLPPSCTKTWNQTRTPWRSSYTRMDNVIQCLLFGSFWLSIWLDFSCRCLAIAAANQRAGFAQFTLYHSITHEWERERGNYGLLKGSQKLAASSIIKGIKLYLHWTDSCVSLWVSVRPAAVVNSPLSH